MYNPAIAKFLSVDPLSQKYPELTPYQFASNTPIAAIDLDGLEGYQETPVDESSTAPERTGTEKKGDESPDGKYVFTGPGDQTDRPGLWIRKPSASEIAETRAKILQGIEAARERDAHHAADNLEYWLNGKGGTKDADSKWLAQVPEVREGINLNIERFMSEPNSKHVSIEILGYNLKDGETVVHKDYWVAQVQTYFNPVGNKLDNEFYFAWGTAILKTEATFTITRTGDVYKVVGQLAHEFSDVYNWEPGLSVILPDGKVVSDQQLIPQEIYGTAKPFKGRASWIEPFEKTVKPTTFLFKSKKQ